jgi:type I site-specific restriction endonuclease
MHLNNRYADWCKANSRARAEPYAFKCTSLSSGNKMVEDLRGTMSSWFIATTVDLLSTGVDVPCVRNIKVGKKTPLTMLQFVKFFELLDKRGTPEAETEHSWTVDFAERTEKAREEAAPHRREADTQRERSATLREQSRTLRKAGKSSEAEALFPEIEAADKAVREATAKAQTIEDTVYDLKAVNPREKTVVDARTPVQLLEAISEKGREVDAALARLKGLLSAEEGLT